MKSGDLYQQALTVGSVPAMHAADPVTRYKVAITEGERRLTWQELNGRSTRVAAALIRYGVRQGEPVALYCGNRIEYIELMYGLAKAGCPIVPLSPRFVAAEVTGAVNATGARALVTDNPRALGLPATAAPDGALTVARLRAPTTRSGDFSELADDVQPYEDILASAGAPGTDIAELPEPDENVPFRLSLTSGTTGAPKVCVVPQRVAMQGWAEMSIGLGIGPDDVELVAGPLFHGLGFTCALQQLYVGGSLVIHRRFDARKVLDSIARDRTTIFPGVPMIFDRILAEPRSDPADTDTSSVRLLMSSGARAGGALKRRLAEAFRGAVICEFLAGTETGIIAVNRADPHGSKADSCGLPFFRTRLGILDEAGKAQPQGKIGEVAKRGLLTGPVYLGDDKRTAEAFHDGWFRTGDLGYVDEDGYLFLVGRRKDIIVSGGINVYPAEIEDVIRSMPGVREVAVVGIPDEVWGESVKAVLVLDEGVEHAPSEIERHCRAELAGYKIPRVIAFTGALPRTGSGKVLNRELASVPGFRRTDDGWLPAGSFCWPPRQRDGRLVAVTEQSTGDAVPERWNAVAPKSNMWMDPAQDPRFAAGAELEGERATLLDYLRAYRLALELKCAGLDAEQLARRSVPPSTMSLLGLVRHMADVERNWFRRVMARASVPPLYWSDDAEDADWAGAVADPAVVAGAWRAWREEVAFAEQFVAGSPDLAIRSPMQDGTTVALREVILHMVEEYARHLGHADLLRERIDGRVGQ